MDFSWVDDKIDGDYRSAVALRLRQLADLTEVERPLMYYVYAIYNRTYDKIYIGQTEDLQIRLESHNKKTFGKSYTARFGGNWELIYKERLDDRRAALIREKQLKSYRGREFIRSHIPR